MVCPYCANQTAVTNSRSRKGGLEVWRRRKCSRCQAVFTTHESLAGEQALLVQKGKHYQPFQRDKLYVSIFDALKHRKGAVSDATALTATVMQKLRPAFSSGAVPTDYITWRTLEVLRYFDKAAASHYQAFHASKE